MSRTLALIATMAVLELGFSSTPVMSENSTASDMPANSESISDTAAAEQPAKFIGDDKSAVSKTPADATAQDKTSAGSAPQDQSSAGSAPAASSADAASTDKPAPDASAANKTSGDGTPADKPAKGRPVMKMLLKSSTPKFDDGKSDPDSGKELSAKSSGKSTKVSSRSKHSEDKDEDKDDKELQDEKESAANAYMSQDDSGFKVDPLVYYQEGINFMKLKKYQQALDSFNKALEVNPKFYEASFRKALVYQLTGYDKFAARRYQDVIKYCPTMDQARINLAALHRKHKHYSGAEEQLEAVIQHNWASFEGHYNLANVFVEDNKMDEALKEYKFCLKLKPNNANLHNNMGVLFLQKNYPDEALQEFRKAAQLAPRNQMFLSNINTAAKQIAQKKAKGLTM